MGAAFSDPIVGIATAAGAAGVGIVRLSGPGVALMAEQIFAPSGSTPLRQQPPRKLVHGWIRDQGKDLDEALCVFMPGPHSFTAEDVIEFQCHGGIYLLQRVLQLCLAQGARLARPGEFTQRAFLHGRIDLTQAEAIGHLTQAKSRLGLEVNVNQLKGQLEAAIQKMKGKLSQVLAVINGAIEFSDQDIDFQQEQSLQAQLNELEAELHSLIRRSEQCHLIAEGFQVAITGRPNVGKSSLLNGLLQQDRAIVAAQPGTTRDLIQASIELAGVPLELVDTAGIRETPDQVEQAGIQKSLSALARADLVLWVIDCSNPDFTLLTEEQRIKAEKPVFVVFNKQDLAAPPPLPPLPFVPAGQIGLCAEDAASLDQLRDMLAQYVQSQTMAMVEETSLTNLRQLQAAKEAGQALHRAQEAQALRLGEEVVALELQACLHSLGEIVGETTPEELLNQIFANFCIGK